VSDILNAVVLGIVQGLTEFLPVSSTGHLVITEKILGVGHDEFGLRFDAAIHLGTLAAVIVYFRRMVADIVLSWLLSIKARRWDHSPSSRLAWLLIIGTIPAGLIGLAIESTAESTFRSTALVALMLILFCIPLLAAERFGKQDRDLSHAGPLDAILLGLAQSVALIPGVSRSGITISAAMFAGFKREQAAVFTFLLSAPIIAAAGGKQIFDIARGQSTSSGLDNEIAVYAAGLVTAAIVGYAAIAFLVRYLRTNPLHLFVAYRLIFGATILCLVATNVL
jgi:undecaprenyl-diphosphatase